MAKIMGPDAPITSGTIANGATDYSKTFVVSSNSGPNITCSVIATGGTSGTVTCTFQASFDGSNWWDLVMTNNTFTFTGGATTQVVARVLTQLSGGGGATAAVAVPGIPAPFLRLKIANGAAASITAVQVYWHQAG